MSTIFGYEWEDIKRAQQGGRLGRVAPQLRTATVPCLQCGKCFPPTGEFPVSCKHCGHAHTQSDSVAAGWPTLKP